MAAERTRWTDERLDDGADRLDRFERNVDRRFDKVDQRFDRFESSVDERFDKVDQRFDRFESSVDERFDKVDRRFDRFESSVDRRFDKVDERIEQMATKEQLEKLDSEWKERLIALGEKFDRMQLTLVGGLITIVGAVIMQSFLG